MECFYLMYKVSEILGVATPNLMCKSGVARCKRGLFPLFDKQLFFERETRMIEKRQRLRVAQLQKLTRLCHSPCLQLFFGIRDMGKDDDCRLLSIWFASKI